MPSPGFRIRLLAVVLATLCFGAIQSAATVTFLGAIGSSTSGRVVVGWVGGTPDSLVDSFDMSPDSIYSGVSLQSSVNQNLATPVFLSANSQLTLAASGPVDSTVAVVRGTVFVSEYGANNPPARWAQARLDLALRYQADNPTIYWVIRFGASPGANGPPGPPGDGFVAHPPGDSDGFEYRGSLPNTGEMHDIGALIETVMGDGQFGSWYGGRSFTVYLDDVEFTHPVAGVTAEANPRIELYPPRPNPARVGMRVEFNLAREARTTLAIFDCTGRLVRLLADDDLGSGTHSAVWDGNSGQGTPAGTGLYFVRLAVGRESVVRRLVLLR